MKSINNILKRCFWDYDFTENDIIRIIKSKDKTKEKAFLFAKILKNSDNVLNDLTIFNEKDLIFYLKEFQVPEFNFEYINTRYLILRNYFLNEKVNIPKLAWKV